jgi:hypothetical protein
VSDAARFVRDPFLRMRARSAHATVRALDCRTQAAPCSHAGSKLASSTSPASRRWQMRDTKGRAVLSPPFEVRKAIAAHLVANEGAAAREGFRRVSPESSLDILSTKGAAISIASSARRGCRHRGSEMSKLGIPMIRAFADDRLCCVIELKPQNANLFAVRDLHRAQIS